MALTSTFSGPARLCSRAYGMTFFITIVGTICNVVFTIGLAYPLSRPELKGRNVIAFLVFFTMLFNGGLVPTYIIYSQNFPHPVTRSSP